jgi:hypothetical protein
LASRVAERLLHELAELARCSGVSEAIMRSAAAPRRARESTSSSRSRVVREEVAVLGHELVELLLGVLAARVGRQHRVEVGEHVLDARIAAGSGRLERLLAARGTACRAPRAQLVLQLS